MAIAAKADDQPAMESPPREAAAPEPPRRAQPQREPPREQDESSQAPLDLPPPPPTKPFVVWSSSPTDAVPEPRRDE